METQPINLTEDALGTSGLERLLVPSASQNVAILENKSQGMKGWSGGWSVMRRRASKASGVHGHIDHG